MRQKGNLWPIRCMRFQCEVLHIGGEEEWRGQDVFSDAHFVLKTGTVLVGPKQDF